MIVRKEPNGPETHLRLRMHQRFLGQRRVEAAGKVDGPQRFQRESAFALEELLGQKRKDGAVLAIAHQPLCRLAHPAIVFLQALDELGGSLLAKIDTLAKLGEEYFRHSTSWAEVFLPRSTLLRNLASLAARR